MTTSATSRQATILVVDDEALIRWSLGERLREEGYIVVAAASGAEASVAAQDGPDLILLDMRLPDADGMDLLREFRRDLPSAPVIMMTGHSSVEAAVEAMRQGALHYAVKPVSLDEIVVLVQHALATSALEREVAAHRETASAPYAFDHIIGASAAMRRSRSMLERIAATPAGTVLLTGESGTGKDLAAKAIHYNSSRAARPFMNVTCSALVDSLLESELFGHERGAFTDAKRSKRGLLEEADGGTVCLDEIGETSAAMQAKLLRFLEDHTFKRVGGVVDVCVDVRVIAATNRNLEDEVASGRFREDLYYRLRVLPIELPPLRERDGDIPLLVSTYVDRYAREFKRDVPRVDADAMAELARYPWPGNIRELRNVVERAVLLSAGGRLGTNDFLVLDRRRGGDAKGVTLPAAGLRLDDIERSLVEQALVRTAGNQTAAAKLLGISRDQMRYRVEKFGFTGATWA